MWNFEFNLWARKTAIAFFSMYIHAKNERTKTHWIQPEIPGQFHRTSRNKSDPNGPQQNLHRRVRWVEVLHPFTSIRTVSVFLHFVSVSTHTSIYKHVPLYLEVSSYLFLQSLLLLLYLLFLVHSFSVPFSLDPTLRWGSCRSLGQFAPSAGPGTQLMRAAHAVGHAWSTLVMWGASVPDVADRAAPFWCVLAAASCEFASNFWVTMLADTKNCWSNVIQESHLIAPCTILLHNQGQKCSLGHSQDCSSITREHAGHVQSLPKLHISTTEHLFVDPLESSCLFACEPLKG